jgi:hypothetical protein
VADALYFYDFFSLGTLLPLGYLELHAVSLVKRFVTVALNRGIVDEYVRSAVLADKAIPLGIIEPFDLSCST